MKRSLRTVGRSCGRSRGVVLAAAVVGLLGAANTGSAEDEMLEISRAEIEEMEREIEQMDEEHEAATKAGGTFTCADDYCTGLYDDLISYTFLRHDGFSGIRVQASVQPFLAASSVGCDDSSTTIYTQLANESSTLKRETVTQWMNRLQLARAMGYEIRLKWKATGTSWAVCLLDTLYVYDPPDPG